MGRRYVMVGDPKRQDFAGKKISCKELDQREVIAWLQEGPHQIITDPKFESGNELLFVDLSDEAIETILKNPFLTIASENISFYLVKVS